MPTHHPHIHVACNVRTASVVAPVDSTLQTLERFDADGIIDSFAVDAWPDKVQLGDAAPHSDVVEQFEEFDAWAEQWDVSIRPPFAVETRTLEIIDEIHEVLITPVQCLAVYVDGVLREVFPHSATRSGDGETYSVEDALALLEAHDIHGFEADQPPDVPPRERTPLAQELPRP